MNNGRIQLFAVVVVALSACGAGRGSADAPAHAPARAAGYSTNFSVTENPISEGGKWINGKAVGLDWNDVQSVPGKAYAADLTGFPSRYSDPIAHLNTSFAANQYAQGTVSRVPGYRNNIDQHEIELLLRFQITAHNARGYECLFNYCGGVQIMRWNGAMGDFTALPSVPGAGTGSYGRALISGDIVKASIVGNVISTYINGTLIAQAIDSTFTNGLPGISFFIRPGGSPLLLGLSSYSARAAGRP